MIADELCSKSGELGKNVFVLEYNTHFNFTAKLRNEARFIPKYT